MFVIVYLRDPNCYTVVPEEFIMDLKEKVVKNCGINRNQARRIFFSKEWFANQTNKVNLDHRFEPNFRLACTALYPLPNDMAETNYIGRMIMFEDTFEAATQKAAGYRPKMPALYNPSRENERPIPRVELSADQNNEENNDNQEGEQQNPHENSQENASADSQEDLQTTFFESVVLNSADIDAKPVICDEDMAAFDDLFEETASNERDPLTDDVQAESFGNGIVQESTRIDDNLQAKIVPDELRVANVEAGMQQNEDEDNRGGEERKRQIDENARKVLLYGKRVVVDTDVEYISLPNQKLEAIKSEPKYQVKTNDLLSGKKAFKENVIF